MREELAREISSLERSITCQEQRLAGVEPVVKILLRTAKGDAASAASTLYCKGRSLVELKQRRTLLCANSVKCGEVTVPFSKYCLQREWIHCVQCMALRRVL